MATNYNTYNPTTGTYISPEGYYQSTAIKPEGAKLVFNTPQFQPTPQFQTISQAEFQSRLPQQDNSALERAKQLAQETYNKLQESYRLGRTVQQNVLGGVKDIATQNLEKLYSAEASALNKYVLKPYVEPALNRYGKFQIDVLDATGKYVGQPVIDKVITPAYNYVAPKVETAGEVTYEKAIKPFYEKVVIPEALVSYEKAYKPYIAPVVEKIGATTKEVFSGKINQPPVYPDLSNLSDYEASKRFNQYVKDKERYNEQRLNEERWNSQNAIILDAITGTIPKAWDRQLSPELQVKISNARFGILDPKIAYEIAAYQRQYKKDQEVANKAASELVKAQEDLISSGISKQELESGNIERELSEQEISAIENYNSVLTLYQNNESVKRIKDSRTYRQIVADEKYGFGGKFGEFLRSQGIDVEKQKAIVAALMGAQQTTAYTLPGVRTLSGLNIAMGGLETTSKAQTASQLAGGVAQTGAGLWLATSGIKFKDPSWMAKPESSKLGAKLALGEWNFNVAVEKTKWLGFGGQLGLIGGGSALQGAMIYKQTGSLPVAVGSGVGTFFGFGTPATYGFMKNVYYRPVYRRVKTGEDININWVGEKKGDVRWITEQGRASGENVQRYLKSNYPSEDFPFKITGDYQTAGYKTEVTYAGRKFLESISGGRINPKLVYSGIPSEGGYSSAFGLLTNKAGFSPSQAKSYLRYIKPSNVLITEEFTVTTVPGSNIAVVKGFRTKEFQKGELDGRPMRGGASTRENIKVVREIIGKDDKGNLITLNKELNRPEVFKKGDWEMSLQKNPKLSESIEVLSADKIKARLKLYETQDFTLNVQPEGDWSFDLTQTAKPLPEKELFFKTAGVKVTPKGEVSFTRGDLRLKPEEFVDVDEPIWISKLPKQFGKGAKSSPEFFSNLYKSTKTPSTPIVPPAPINPPSENQILVAPEKVSGVTEKVYDIITPSQTSQQASQTDMLLLSPYSGMGTYERTSSFSDLIGVGTGQVTTDNLLLGSAVKQSLLSASPLISISQSKASVISKSLQQLKSIQILSPLQQLAQEEIVLTKQSSSLLQAPAQESIQVPVVQPILQQPLLSSPSQQGQRARVSSPGTPPSQDFILPPFIPESGEMITKKKKLAEKKKRIEPGFYVVTMKRKKQYLVTPKPLSKSQALGFGLKYTKGTERASFKLIPSKVEPVKIAVKPATESDVWKAGYRPPVKGSKYLEGKDVFIQRKPTRMGTIKETKAIQSYRAKSRIKGFAPVNERRMVW